MATALVALPEVMVQRLAAAPSFGVTDVRRAHRVPTSRDGAPLIRIVPGEIARAKEAGKGSCLRWTMRISVALVVRDDAPLDEADPLLIEAMRRLDPETDDGLPYPTGVLVSLARVLPDEEAADADAGHIELEYEATFAAGEHSIEVAA